MTNWRTPHVLLALLAPPVLGLTGCASQPRSDLANLPGKRACFWIRNVFDWTVLNETTLLVHSPPSDAYLIKLFAPIPDLKFHEALGFEGGDGEPGRFCTDNGYVIVRGAVPQREPVIAVQALTPGEAQQVLARAGHTTPHRQAPQSSAPSS